MRDEFRRTLRFEGARKKDLEIIKKTIGAATDTAAVNDAIEFRARYADHNSREIDLALWLLNRIDVIDQSPTRTVTLVEPAPPGANTKIHHIPVPKLG